VFVLPAATGRLLARGVPGLVAWSALIAATEGVLGLYLALWLDLPPGPPVAALAAGAYGVVALSLWAAGRRATA
jgi:ABC-type Mn2+/Zn2+ transport system permease subunit